MDREVSREIGEGTIGPDKPQSVLNRIIGGLGLGGLYIGSGVLLILYNIVEFLVPAVVGLSMIGWSINEFVGGSVLVGLLVLLIGTPIAIWIARWGAMYIFFLAVITVVIWGIASLFGATISFFSVWDIVSLVFKILLIGYMAFWGIVMFVDAVKTRQIGVFFKENWFFILVFCLLFWLFFL